GNRVAGVGEEPEVLVRLLDLLAKPHLVVDVDTRGDPPERLTRGVLQRLHAPRDPPVHTIGPAQTELDVVVLARGRRLFPGTADPRDIIAVHELAERLLCDVVQRD